VECYIFNTYLCMDEWLSEWTNEGYWVQDQQVRYQVGYCIQLVWSVECGLWSVECSRGTECLQSRVFRVTGTRWPRSRENIVDSWPKKGTTIIADCCLKRRNYEQIVFREYLLSFGAEYFVFQFDTQKFKD